MISSPTLTGTKETACSAQASSPSTVAEAMADKEDGETCEFG
jgi:hypothetical protein